MVMSKNMMFFDINYLQEQNIMSYTYYTITQDTLKYATDNRSDLGFIVFTTYGGSLLYGITSGVYIDNVLLLNHNISGGRLSFFSTITMSNSFYTESFTTNGNDLIFPVSITGLVYGVKIAFSITTTSLNAYIGEFIATKKKFQLSNNPSSYIPKISSSGNVNTLYDGRKQFSETRKNFSAQIGWDYLIGSMDSMSGTDLQNMTELCRQKVSFLFFPNGGNTGTGNYPDIYGWRPMDVFKCRIFDDTTYNFPIKGNLGIINANYNIEEVI